MNIRVTKTGEARCPDAPSVQDLLDRERRPVPAVLREQHYTYVGSDTIPVSRYLSRDFHRLEVEKVWKKTWQMACREEEIPNPGDHVLYEINDNSMIVMRQPDGTIKALHNVCLHRGRKLRDVAGSVSQLRCPYHGFTWEIDGTSKVVPCPWDFPHVDPARFALPEARVGTWGGFVFVNMDAQAPALADYLGDLPRHFAAWELDRKYKFAHVAKIVNMNWKVGVEAFIESFHVIATHPQILPNTADANTQYDNYEGRHFNRMITSFGLPSPHLTEPPSDRDIVQSMADRVHRLGGSIDGFALPEGMTAREFLAGMARRNLEKETGRDFSGATDCEMIDAIQYFVFPNFFPWGGPAQNIIYRFRPWKNDPDWALMEVMLLRHPPKDGPRPAPAPMKLLKEDEAWSSAAELSSLGPVFDQDMANMPRVQEGMKASVTGALTLANYAESRVHDLHRLLDRYIAA